MNGRGLRGVAGGVLLALSVATAAAEPSSADAEGRATASLTDTVQSAPAYPAGYP